VRRAPWRLRLSLRDVFCSAIEVHRDRGTQVDRYRGTQVDR
jgi:hypothetical protein